MVIYLPYLIEWVALRLGSVPATPLPIMKVLVAQAFSSSLCFRRQVARVLVIWCSETISLKWKMIRMTRYVSHRLQNSPKSRRSSPASTVFSRRSACYSTTFLGVVMPVILWLLCNWIKAMRMAWSSSRLSMCLSWVTTRCSSLTQWLSASCAKLNSKECFKKLSW